jgi:hypothetical protein
MMSVQAVTDVNITDERTRETWREVMSMRRRALLFRARLARTLPMIENESGRDVQLGDVATTIAVLVRIIDWATRDLDRLHLPEELLEVVPLVKPGGRPS